MQVKTFEAVDMKQALRLVREELGPDAVIVSTRSVRRDHGLFGLLGRSVLEVTAAVKETKRSAPLAIKGSLAPEARPARSRSAGVFHDLWAVKRAVDPIMDEVRAIKDSVAGLEERGATDPAELRSDVAQIRSMLASIVASGSVAPDAEGASAQRLFYFLLARGVDEPLARSLVQRVVSRVESGALGDLERLKLNLATEMRVDLSRAERGVPPGPVQMFVGPSGVGKTTTIAKLAARASRNAPDGVLIVTTDVHRVAAVEQMAKFGEILGVPVEVAINSEDLSRILSQHAQRERIFIDTPGRNHRDGTALRELKGLIEAARDAELLLVTSATTRATDSRELLEAYAGIPYSRLIVTKLDETRVHGELYNSVVRSGRPIACVTTGQAVPDHLESLDVAGILRRVLHG